MRIPSILITLVTGLFLSIGISHAAVNIVATVNGEPITNYDLTQRAKFIQLATNLEASEENQQRLLDDAIQMLIDDKLKIQAAKSLRTDIESVALPMAKELIDNSYGKDGMSGSKMLRTRGLDPATVQSKYLADLAWSDYLRTKYQDKFGAIEGKIDDELDRLVANASQPQLRLSEIVLSPSPTRSYKQTLDLAGQMVDAIRKGADFAAVAEQYSAAGTGQKGGRIGWVVTNRLPTEFRDILTVTKNGAITNPIELDGAVYIFKREGNREKGLADASQARFWLARAILGVPADATNPDRLEAAARIERDSKALDNCEDLVALHNTYGTGTVSELNEMLFADLAPQMQNLVSSLENGVASEPLAFAEGVAVFMVCKREAPKIDLPSREEVQRFLMDKLFGSISERNLIRLRRSAVIDIRG